MPKTIVDSLVDAVDALLVKLSEALNVESARREGAVDAPGSMLVHELQADLQELGFLLVQDQDGKFDRYVRWAVRDFQSYAKMTHTARMSTAMVRLATPLYATEATARVGPGTEFLALGLPFTARVGSENVSVTAREVADVVTGEEVWTLMRGRDGSDAAEHRAGAVVAYLPEPRYSSALESVEVPQADRYVGAVSGVVNPRTQALLSIWKERRYRCPVVVEGWTVDRNGRRVALYVIPATPPGVVPARPTRLADNVWLAEEGWVVPPQGIAALRFFVRDFSRHWPRPVGHPPDGPHVDALTPLGILWRWPHQGSVLVGEWLSPLHRMTWTEAEVLPEAMGLGTMAQLVAAAAVPAGSPPGTPPPAVPAARLSSFKVVRAIAEVEPEGYFDAVQTYDQSFLSMGLCHWTAGMAIAAAGVPRLRWSVDEGELWALLALLRSRPRWAADYERLAGHWGLAPDRAWIGDGRAAGGLWGLEQRKYTARATQTDEAGRPVSLSGFPPPTPGVVQEYGQHGEYDAFRLWHVFYRFVMAARTGAGLREAEWVMARTRIRDVLSAPWNPTPAMVANSAPGTFLPLQAGVTLGDVFTSELAVALLYRWHIFSPAQVLFRAASNPAPPARRMTPVETRASHGFAGTRLHAIVLAAEAATRRQLAWRNGVGGWGDQHETALGAAILAGQPAGSLADTMNDVANWIGWNAQANPRRFTLDMNALGGPGPTLSRLRGSFRLDVADLP